MPRRGVLCCTCCCCAGMGSAGGYYRLCRLWLICSCYCLPAPPVAHTTLSVASLPLLHETAVMVVGLHWQPAIESECVPVLWAALAQDDSEL